MIFVDYDLWAVAHKSVYGLSSKMVLNNMGCEFRVFCVYFPMCTRCYWSVFGLLNISFFIPLPARPLVVLNGSSALSPPAWALARLFEPRGSRPCLAELRHRLFFWLRSEHAFGIFFPCLCPLQKKSRKNLYLHYSKGTILYAGVTNRAK